MSGTLNTVSLRQGLNNIFCFLLFLPFLIFRLPFPPCVFPRSFHCQRKSPIRLDERVSFLQSDDRANNDRDPWSGADPCTSRDKPSFSPRPGKPQDQSRRELQSDRAWRCLQVAFGNELEPLLALLVSRRPLTWPFPVPVRPGSTRRNCASTLSTLVAFGRGCPLSCLACLASCCLSPTGIDSAQTTCCVLPNASRAPFQLLVPARSLQESFLPGEPSHCRQLRTSRGSPPRMSRARLLKRSRRASRPRITNGIYPGDVECRAKSSIDPRAAPLPPENKQCLLRASASSACHKLAG